VNEVLYQGEDLRLDRTGRVATLTLDRPPVNAFRTATWREVGAALTAAAEAAVSVLVLRSALAGMFSAGADIKEPAPSPEDAERRTRLTRGVLDAVHRAPFPVIAAVDGPALGGACALVSAADIRIAGPRATFGLPEINVGRCGGARYLMRHLGQGTVRWLYFTGDTIDAERAERLGLVAWVAGDLDGDVEQLAGRIAAKSPTALRVAKQSLNLVEWADVAAGYETEQQFDLRLAGHPDSAEAAAAFREKRPPRWLAEQEAGC
jgi:enoyl-CoA hydratase